MSGERLDPLLRWSRATVTAGVALSLATVAHTSAGGRLPSLPGVALIGTVTVVVCAVVLRRPASTVRVVTLVVAAQTAGHLVLTAVAGHGRESAPTAIAVPRPVREVARAAGERRLGSLHDLTQVEPSSAASAAPPAWMTHLVADLTGPHALMALAHLVAAALLGCWLAAGERALWSLISLGGEGARTASAHLVALLRRHHAWSTVRPAAPARGPAHPSYDDAAPPAAVLCRLVTRRGPPLPALAA